MIFQVKVKLCLSSLGFTRQGSKFTYFEFPQLLPVCGKIKIASSNRWNKTILKRNLIFHLGVLPSYIGQKKLQEKQTVKVSRTQFSFIFAEQRKESDKESRGLISTKNDLYKENKDKAY